MPINKLFKQTVVVALTLFPLVSTAEENRVKLPNIDDLVHYTTVTRGEVTEHIMTQQTTIDALQQGEPAPNGSQFVLVDYRDSRIYRYFVMEKGENWEQIIQPIVVRMTGNFSGFGEMVVSIWMRILNDVSLVTAHKNQANTPIHTTT